MKSRTLFLSTLTAVLLSATAAMAVPTATVDGITIPIDTALPGGAVLGVQIDREDLLTGAPGQTLSGEGIVSNIQDFPHGVTTYSEPTCNTVGCSGLFLTDVFNGLVVRTTSFDSNTGETTVYLTGNNASLDYYIENSRPNLNTGNAALDMANATSSTLFLALTPAVIDQFGDVMTIIIPGSDIGNFTGVAQGQAFLNVNSGDAADIFNTNTFATGFNGTTADIRFVGNANNTGSGEQPVGGSDDIWGNTVPEPASLAILGAGLFIVSWSLRRRRASRTSD